MAGFEGKTIEVDLSSGKISKIALDKSILRPFIGGSGLGAKLIYDRVDPKVDPLSPDNPMFIVTGPLSGNALPGGSRFAVCAKAPLTNMFGEANCGGDFAQELRGAGWDHIIINGASEKPVYLLIQDDKVELADASDLWGKSNFEVHRILKERHGGKKPKVVAIGQAGEKLVKFAAVCNGEKDFAARCGMGALMGSKKLKAIVAVGSGRASLADPQRFAERRKVAIQKARADVACMVLGMSGTAGATEIAVALGDIPGRNWVIAGNTGANAIGGVVLNGPQFLKGHESCHGCIVGCKRIMDIKEGAFAGYTGPGPEYEGVGALGSNLLVHDMGAVVKLNQMCNDYGMDVISTGGSIAMAMDCYEQGILSQQDLDGIDLKWGNIDGVMAMITKIAGREGIGDLLAEGTRRMAQKLGKGTEEYAIHVKGLEMPMHDPRSNHGLALSYATGPRGACHTNDPAYTVGTGIFNWPEFGLTPLLAAQTKISKGWGPVIVGSQNLGQIVNAGILCYMVTGALNSEDLTDLISSASGFDYTFPELQQCGERIWLMKRGVNNLMGITSKDDVLPGRVLIPPAEGGAAGSSPDIKLLLEEFYPARGLAADGRPTREALDKVGLGDLAARLHS